ncbi:MAG: DUF899 family protein [Planctomycetota bacterium]|jgi:predicted dithiol-disulfide oxidoreductase (DUF899 family)
MVRPEIEQAEKELAHARQRLLEARRSGPPEPFEDFALRGPGGETVRLSQLFDRKDDLIVVHNMGRSCPYCTMWADGFNGVLPHLEDRAAFVVVSPDSPAMQAEFAAGRGWRFRMLSAEGSGFTKAAGYETEEGAPRPGVSTFRRTEDGGLVRVAHAPFGPGDPFCGVWHLFDLLHDGWEGWRPQFQY